MVTNKKEQIQDEERKCKNCGHMIWRNKVNPKWNHKRVSTASFTTCFVKLEKEKHCGCRKAEAND